jgi:hypothetical protein
MPTYNGLYSLVVLSFFPYALFVCINRYPVYKRMTFNLPLPKCFFDGYIVSECQILHFISLLYIDVILCIDWIKIYFIERVQSTVSTNYYPQTPSDRTQRYLRPYSEITRARYTCGLYSSGVLYHICRFWLSNISVIYIKIFVFDYKTNLYYFIKKLVTIIRGKYNEVKPLVYRHFLFGFRRHWTNERITKLVIKIPQFMFCLLNWTLQFIFTFSDCKPLGG